MTAPERFGPYLLHHRLALGGTSEVFLAQTTGEYRRLCAVRRILPGLASLPEFEDRFRRDAKLLVRLTHGNVVQVLEVGAVEERPFVAMEQIDGIDLGELITDVPQQGALPAELALYLGIEMCEATDYLHTRRQEEAGAARFPHDAAWPLEVMVSFDGMVKLVDLGSFGALRLGQQSVARLLRSPGYAAPEIIRKQMIDLRTDVFAVGLVLWECLSGQRLVATDPEGYVRHVLAGSWKAPLVRRQDVPGDVIRLIGEMLDADPVKRPADLERVRARLVSSLRRTAPAYGSAALSRLLWSRCRDTIGIAEQLTARIAKQAPTIQAGERAGGAVRSFSKHGTDDGPGDPAQAKPLQPGDRIPGTRYRIERHIGRGGSAEVYAAQHVDLDRKVAVKVLSPQLSDSAEAIAQFRMEARGCSRIAHANIVDVIDFGELDDGRFFFAMELLEGRSLADLIEQHGPLPPGRALGIARQIARALHAAHAQGIVHRDVKPDNVMLVEREGREDFVKVLDFGVMAFTHDAEHYCVGTPGYMAPEQVAGRSPTPPMDVYGLGSTLYEMLAGATAYPSKDTAQFIRAQTRHPPRALRSRPETDDIPAAFERVVHRALEREPEARQQTMVELERELLRAQREAGVVSDWDDLPPLDAGPSAPAPRPARRRLLWAGAGLAATAVVLLVILLQRDDQRVAPAPLPPPPPPPPPRVIRVAAPPAKAPPAIAGLIDQIEAAVAAGHFTRPVGKSALDLVEQLQRVAPGTKLGERWRRRITELLGGAGDRLAAAGLRVSARTLYQEAVLFTPDDARLLALAFPDPSQRSTGQRPAPNAARIAQLVAEVQQAVADGRYFKPEDRSALAYLRQLKRLDPSGTHARAARQEMYRTLRDDAARKWSGGQRDRARQLYRMLAAVDPDDALAKQRAEAVDEPAPGNARATAHVDQATALALVTEARSLLAQGEVARARTRFVAALRANPRSPRAVTGLATVAFEEGRYTQAVELAERAIRINPRHLAAQMLLGDVYFKLLRYADALAAWKRVLELKPGHARATKRIALLHRRTGAAR